MKRIVFLISAFAILILASSCVTQKSYAELEETLEYYKKGAIASDSISNEYRRLEERNRECDSRLKKAYYELEQLTVTNQSLNRSYQEILGKYNEMVTQNKDVLRFSEYEKLGLQERLSAQEAELDKRERAIALMEYDLEQQKMQVENYENTSSSKDQRIRELEASLNLKEEKMNELREALNDVLTGFSNADLTLTNKNGKLYVSLSQELLFKSGSTTINWKGKKALMQVADVLKDKTDLEITVEGHTDSDGSAAKNWNLSVDRSTEVVKFLSSHGINPAQLIASGRGLYHPVASNDTTEGKALNRRTEIIISPQLDDLYQFIED